jgi:hypothetical protein
VGWAVKTGGFTALTPTWRVLADSNISLSASLWDSGTTFKRDASRLSEFHFSGGHGQYKSLECNRLQKEDVVKNISHRQKVSEDILAVTV